MVHCAILSASALAGFPPWQVMATKPLSCALGVDPYLLGMRRYRGLGPPALPDDWVKGRVNAYKVTDLRRWLGDPRTDVEQYCAALSDLLSQDEANDPPLVRLFALAQAKNQSPLGFQFTPMGQQAYLDSICPL